MCPSEGEKLAFAVAAQATAKNFIRKEKSPTVAGSGNFVLFQTSSPKQEAVYKILS
jgi:hypothetical protein